MPNQPGFLPGDTLGIEDTTVVNSFAEIDYTENSSPIILSSYPNPFRHFCYVNYVLPKAGKLQILLMDDSGRNVQEVFSGEQGAGNYVLQLPGKDLPAGNHYLLFLSSNKNTVKQLIKLAD